MPTQLIDGKAIAQKIRAEVVAEVARCAAAGKPQPILATVLVGAMLMKNTLRAAQIQNP